MKMPHVIFAGILSAGLCLFAGCQAIPLDAVPVSSFDVNKYVGKWYEIARFDFTFEKNLNNTTAEYTLNPDNSVKVVNRGFNIVKQKWEQAVGKAKFRGKSDVAALEVSFFGPFYSGYNVIALEGDYEYALVAGKNLDYLWILSRTPEIPPEIAVSFIKTAQSVGFNTDRFIWVSHSELND